jgi:hypothetical protein
MCFSKSFGIFLFFSELLQPFERPEPANKKNIFFFAGRPYRRTCGNNPIKTQKIKRSKIKPTL